MKSALILMAAAIPALAQQNFDFRLIERLGAGAKSSTSITLDGNLLKLAASFVGSGDESLKSLARGLTGVYVRSYQFERPGQYLESDLEPLRAYLRSGQWSKIVDVKEATKEGSEIYVQALPNDRLGGVVVISAESKEVTVVFISGVMNASDVAKLSGNLGIPDLPDVPGLKKSGK
jgi:Domain of unknown function (DUF4252)